MTEHVYSLLRRTMARYGIKEEQVDQQHREALRRAKAQAEAYVKLAKEVAPAMRLVLPGGARVLGPVVMVPTENPEVQCTAAGDGAFVTCVLWVPAKLLRE